MRRIAINIAASFLLESNHRMQWLITAFPLPVTAALFFLIGACVGNRLVRWMVWLTPLEASAEPAGQPTDEVTHSSWWQQLPLIGSVVSRGGTVYRGERIGAWGGLIELATGLLFAAFVVAMLALDCQRIEMVIPTEFWRYGRIVYHLVLISLLIVATGTDFREYIIHDGVTVTGVIIGVAGATISGELQMIHIWIDWNVEIPGFRPPYFPPWIADHTHLHGLAWSVAGLAAGAGITWLVRILSRLLLGQAALGFGDVTLMAMVGSFLGWQPVLFVLLLAPLCGTLMGVAVRVVTGRNFIPFGPYLAAATLVVLFTWRWLWMFEIPWTGGVGLSIRRLFGDWPSLAILAGVAVGGTVVLLGLIRIYRSIPVDRRGSE